MTSVRHAPVYFAFMFEVRTRDEYLNLQNKYVFFLESLPQSASLWKNVLSESKLTQVFYKVFFFSFYNLPPLYVLVCVIIQ